MDSMLGPDGQPSTFDGAAWVSRDGKYWWNGAAWQPVKKPGLQLPVALLGIILIFIAGAWFFATKVLPPPGTTAVVLGVSNSKIDSQTQLELDYARTDPCPDLIFDFVFYDKSGHPVGGIYESDHHYNVSGGTRHHYVFYTLENIPAAAVRFDASPICHS